MHLNREDLEHFQALAEAQYPKVMNKLNTVN